MSVKNVNIHMTGVWAYISFRETTEKYEKDKQKCEEKCEKPN